MVKQPLEGFPFNSTYRNCERNFNEDSATLFIEVTSLILFKESLETFETDRTYLYYKYILLYVLI